MTSLTPDSFRQFFDDSPQAMWVFDLADAHFLAVNKAACERYEYTEEEFLRMRLYDLRNKQDAGELTSALDRFRTSGRVATPTVWEHRTKSGKRLWVEVLSNVVTMGEFRAGFAVLRDVTQEREIRDQQDRFFELSQDIMVIRALDQTLIKINPAATKILGWTPDELANLSPAELTHSEDDHARARAYSEASSTGISRTWRARLRTKAGSYRWVDWSGAIDMEQERAYAVGRDVTEARTVHEQLLTSEANLAWAQGVSHLGSWSYNLGSGTFTLSDEYYRITGYEPGGFAPIWENIVACVHPDDREKVESEPPTISDGKQHQEFEVRIVRPDGEIRNVVSFVESGFRADGSLEVMHGTIQDITERKKAQETQTWLSEIVSSSGESIIGLSLDGIVQSWNKAAENLFGYSAAEMIGQDVERLLPANRKYELNGARDLLARGERIAEFETERIHKSGAVFEAAVTVSPVQTVQGQVIGAAAICRDISARKEAERKLSIQLSQLTALRHIDQSISGTFDLANTLEVVVAQTLATTAVEAVCIFILDRRSGLPTVIESGARDGFPVSGRRIYEAENLARTMVLGRTQSIEDKLPVQRGEICHGRALLAKHEIKGVMTVHYRAKPAQTEDQARFLDTLAGQAGIAVESAWLFEDLQRSHDDLKAAYDETLEGWARALDLRDHETEGHSRRVTDLTIRLAAKLGLPYSEMQHIRRGALLHDIGKLGVPDHILLKPGALTEEEWKAMKLHPTHGRDIIAPIAFLAPALDIPYCHHEKWDGSGYPRGLKGEDIPLSARLFAFADVWDALTSDRPYRKAWDRERVREHIESEAGTHFDPVLTWVFLDLVSG